MYVHNKLDETLFQIMYPIPVSSIGPSTCPTSTFCRDKIPAVFLYISRGSGHLAFRGVGGLFGVTTTPGYPKEKCVTFSRKMKGWGQEEEVGLGQIIRSYHFY